MNNKQLYKVSKFAYQEAFLQSQLDMAGSNQSKILEQMEKNKKYMKIQGIVMKSVVVIYLAIMVILPIQAYNNIIKAINAGIISSDYLQFAGTITLSIFFLVQSLYLIMFGMFFASSLISGDWMQWLTTLPLKQKEIQKISMMTFFRGTDAQFITLFLIFPVGTAIITHSILITLVSIVVSGLNVCFSFGILVLIGEKVHRVMSNNDANSRKNDIARIVVLLSYAILTIAVALGINLALPLVDKLFANETISSDVLSILNQIFSIIPVFNGAFLITSILIGFSNLSLSLIISTFIGLIIFILLIKKVINKALKLLSGLIYYKTKSFDENIIPTTIEDVSIKIVSPIQAFFNKDKQMATRDIQMLMLIIMPILLPFVGIFTSGLAEGGEGLMIMLTVNTLYLIMSGAMCVWGLLNVETTGASIHASLPIVVRDQVKSKIKWLYIILPISSLLPVLFYIGKPNFWDVLILSFIILPMGPISGLIILELKVRMFGKMKYKYIIEEIKLAHKIFKWILLVIVDLALYIGLMILFFSTIGIDSTKGIGNIAMVLLPTEAVLGLIIYYFFNKMFPKPVNRFY